MNQKNGRTDPGPLRERARSLFISQATIDETLEWATPRQLDAIDRMLATELANREASKRARLMRQARFPVPKSLDGYDFANVRLPCFASMFVRQVRQCFSVVWADGFPRCRHRFPVM